MINNAGSRSPPVRLSPLFIRVDWNSLLCRLKFSLSGCAALNPNTKRNSLDWNAVSVTCLSSYLKVSGLNPKPPESEFRASLCKAAVAENWFRGRFDTGRSPVGNKSRFYPTTVITVQLKRSIFSRFIKRISAPVGVIPQSSCSRLCHL